MLRLAWAPIFALLVFVGQEVHSEEEPTCEAHHDEPWSYGGENGMDNWGKRYPACKGKKQSPINIKVRDAVKVIYLKELKFPHYGSRISSAVIENNGHTVQLTPTDGVVRSIERGGLPCRYNFTQLHFHWGAEHLINEQRHPLEMHMVHTCEEIIAVVAVLFKKCPKDNAGLSPILNSFSSIKYKGDRTDLSESVCLRCLLPEHPQEYFRYQGSLTTPPCTEGVVWTVFKNPACISAKQLKQFYSLHSTSEDEPNPCPLQNNYRAVHPLNHRLVTLNVKFTDKRRT